jgi:glucosamine--fructose-6-phosphate aminotransferase (isomerizing)
MRREIAEVPDVLARLLADGARERAAAVEAIRSASPRWVSIVARGTSDHAAIYARYLIETTLGWPVSLAAPSVVSVYGADLAWRGGLVLAISQSGRSPDLVAVVEAARRGGALTVTIANETSSPLAEAADHVVGCHAGPERAVAATKSYVAQLAAVASLVAALAPPARALAPAIERLPSVAAACLAIAERRVHDGAPIVEAFVGSERSLVTSRGHDLATALEIALKLKETGRVFADGYSAADLEHGPIILASADVPLLAIRPDGPMGVSIDGTLATLRRGGSRPWLIAGPEASVGERTIALPIDLPPALGPIVSVLPGQLLAEAVARARGLDPDAPVGLSKVTLTR